MRTVPGRRFLAISRPGFSLLELLIYVAVLSLVTVALSGIFATINQARARAEARAEVDSILRFAMERIETDLRQASAVSDPPSAGAQSSILSMTLAGPTVTYEVVDGQLRRNAEPITPPTITVTNVTFTRLENKNTTLDRTVVSIQTVLTQQYSTANPEYQYAQSKISTTSLR
ncbi:MAG: prepilin-type N-terminal cleavage/methylation domain-containing protein [Candidatus Kerfeldbacteria bacterium]|nr:prepilin-type N-terminal cleavage/methylation domain-containing protein [Candidatus Kerfeldbacteria bacterium]